MCDSHMKIHNMQTEEQWDFVQSSTDDESLYLPFSHCALSSATWVSVDIYQKCLLKTKGRVKTHHIPTFSSLNIKKKKIQNTSSSIFYPKGIIFPSQLKSAAYQVLYCSVPHKVIKWAPEQAWQSSRNVLWFFSFSDKWERLM